MNPNSRLIPVKLGTDLFYRKQKNKRGDDWHFNTKCPEWPQQNYVEVAQPPPSSEL
jgi:hypothetical protein